MPHPGPGAELSRLTLHRSHTTQLHRSSFKRPNADRRLFQIELRHGFASHKQTPDLFTSAYVPQQYRRVIKTNSILRYLLSQSLRRKIHICLNKGEQLPTLRVSLLWWR
ncbi:MAG: hypothetical protein EOO61_03470 [Hymenobacter sp.]|nr:MAG: hypothetical protein EOO61_03470 [Hymenobacter sp.]